MSALWVHIAVVEFVLLWFAILMVWDQFQSNKIWRKGFDDANAELRKRDLIARLRDEDADAKAKAEARAVADECWRLLNTDLGSSLRQLFSRAKNQTTEIQDNENRTNN